MYESQNLKAGEGVALAYQTTMHRATQKEKGDRAFRAYLDLMEAAQTIQYRVRGQLELFGLTFREFQILEMLYSHGAMRTVEVAERCRCNRQNIDLIVKRLEAESWLQAQVVRLPPAEIKPSNLPKGRREKPRNGKRVAVLSLTEMGKKAMGNILVKHKKVIKAFFRALDGREQTSLSVICQKLTVGDPVKLISELMHEDVKE